MQPLYGGKTTLVQTGEYQAILTTSPGWAVAIGIGVALIGVAAVLPDTSSNEA